MSWCKDAPPETLVDLMSRRLGRCVCIALLATPLFGCATTGYRSSHARCLEDPGSYSNNSYRPGGWSKSAGFRWADSGRYGVSRDNSMKATWAIEDCWNIIRVESDNGSYKSLGYGHVGQFSASPDGAHLAFVGSNKGAHVVVDGVESQGWRRILWGPTFSRNSRHVGYLAKDDHHAVAMLDGAVVMRAPAIKKNNFHVFDDGRLAFVRGDGKKWKVVVGGTSSEPFDDVCELSFVARDSGHFAFVGKRAGRYVGVVDGVEYASLGLIANCEMELSKDGEHFAFSTWTNNKERQPAGVIVDGVLHMTPKQAGVVSFVGDSAIASFSTGHEQTAYMVAGAPTPAAAPTKDKYRPMSYSHWCYRVALGESLGPCFDAIDTKSFRKLEDGSYSYRGKRTGGWITVIDNVIRRPTDPALVIPKELPPPPDKHDESPVMVVPGAE